MQDLFNVFHRFIHDTNNDSSDEVDTPKYTQNHPHSYSENNQFNDRELNEFFQSLSSEDERQIYQYLRNQNITDPVQIKAFIKQIQASAQGQQNEPNLSNPADEIERNQKVLENLSSLQYENLARNLNYAINSDNQNSHLVSILLNEVLSGNTDTLQSLISYLGDKSTKQNEYNDLNPDEIVFHKFSDYKRSSYHIAIACFVQQVQKASHNVVLSHLYGGHQQKNGESEHSNSGIKAYVQAEVPRTPPPQKNMYEEPAHSHQNESEQQIDSNLQQMLMLLQTQQMLTNSQHDLGVNQPDLNTLVASTLQESMMNEVQRIFTNPSEATPDDIKIATQKQLADLCEVLNHNKESSRKMMREQVTSED